MAPASEEPIFKQLGCQNRIYGQYEQPFIPIAHDLMVLSSGGDLQVAENVSARQMMNFLARSETELAAFHDAATENTAPLIVL